MRYHTQFIFRLLYWDMVTVPYEYIIASISWIVIFLGYFGIFHFILKPRKIAYTRQPFLFFAYSLCVTIIAILLWRNLFWSYFAQNAIQLLIMTIAIIIIYPLGVFLIKQYRKLPEFEGLENHELDALRGKTSYAATKGIEVLFQDLCILAIFLITKQYFPNVMQQSVALFMVFGGSHLGILAVNSNKVVKGAVILFASCFGFIIPLILNILPFGFFTIFAVHYLFYLVLTPAAFVATRKLGFLQEI